MREINLSCIRINISKVCAIYW